MEEPICTLRSLTEADIDPLASMLGDPRVAATYMVGKKTEKELRELAARCVALSAQPGRYVRAICAGGRVIGMLNDLSGSGRTVEVGYFVAPEAQGKGAATAALAQGAKDLAAMGYTELRAGFFEENTASRRVMEKNGLTPDGTYEMIEYLGTVHRCVMYTRPLR